MGFLKKLGGQGVGIDLGTSNIVVYQSGKGIIFDEPSAVAVRKLPMGGREVIAFGREAKAMEGKTPLGVSVIHPLRDGVIANYDMTETVLRHYLEKAGGESRFSRPLVVVSVPAKVTEVERRAVIDAAMGAGAREAYIIDEPVAAALGAGLPINAPQGNMVLDVGGGTSEVAIISLDGIVVTSSLRSAGEEMDEAIVNMFRQKRALLIGEGTAEQVKIAIGSISPMDEELSMEVKGRDLADGLPKAETVTSVEIREVLMPLVNRIEDTVKMALEQTPPELAKDVADHGIVLVGGASQLRGLAQRLTRSLNTPVILAEDAIHAVVLGVGKALENLDAMKHLLTTVQKRAR